MLVKKYEQRFVAKPYEKTYKLKKRLKTQSSDKSPTGLLQN